MIPLEDRFLTNKHITIDKRILFCLISMLFAYFNFLSISLSAQYQPTPTFSKDQYQFEPFLLPGGKLENIIQCMAQDSTGVIWIGTQNGLVKYDGRKFERFLHDPLDVNSLINNYVECIYVDTDGSLWIGSFTEGFTIFQPEINQFQRYYLTDENGEEIPTVGVNTILRHQNYIWLGTHNGLFRFEEDSKQFKRYYFDPDYKGIFTANVVRALYVDQADTFWMGMGFTWNPDSTNGGLFKYQPAIDTFIAYRQTIENEYSLSDNRVKSIFEDTKNNFWIGTMGDGLNKMDRVKNQFISYPYQPNNRDQLSRPLVQEVKYGDNKYNQVQFIHEDADKRLWIGSFDNGLNIYDPKLAKQIHFERGINGLETNNIWNIFETNDQTIFICSGAEGQGKNYQVSIKRKRFPFFAVPSKTGIKEIREDRDKQIWLAGNDGTKLWQFNPEKKEGKVVSYTQKRAVLSMELSAKEYFSGGIPVGLFREFDLQNIDEGLLVETLQENNFRDLFFETVKKDKAGNIWIGTWGHGLFRINPTTKTIQSFKHNQANTKSIGGDHISVIYEDKQGDLWIGGGKEIKNLNFPLFLDRYDTESEGFTHVYGAQTDYGYPTLIGEDKLGNLWYPTVLDGIHQLTIGTGKVTKYNQSNSLIPADEIRALVVDEADNIWMSAEKSLIRFTPDRQSFIEYSENQGIKVNEFEVGAGHISPNQTIYFGTSNGFYFFDPQIVLQNDKLQVPKISITEFSIRNKTAALFENKLLSAQSGINLKNTENTFSIGFTAMDYNEPQKVHLEYKLENYDNDWQIADDKKIATYYNLPAGTYLFKVKGTNSRGLWNKEGTQMEIIIHPPWWKTNWAYLLFFSSISMGIYGVYQFQLNRQLALQEAKRLIELEETKTRLYVNITHEFRTPLTIIAGMAEKIKEQPQLWMTNGIEMIRRNSFNLLELINQILELEKLESGELKLNVQQGDIISYLKYLLESFHTYAESQGIRLHFITNVEKVVMDFDTEKMSHIITNLLSNAIKFSNKDGDIYLQIHSLPQEKEWIEINIKDNGIGIAPEKLPFIFDRFYQVDSSATRVGEGTGIGLALTKELVQFLDGTIDVKSQVNIGSTFTIVLPIERKAPKQKEVNFRSNTYWQESLQGANARGNTTLSEKKEDLPLVLIIEDNLDVQYYLTACLGEKYQIKYAKNGLIGIEKAIAEIPDLIISDVMMPEKDGFEVCQTLKNKIETSHIPIILLTAKATIEDRIMGLEFGADAYLSKPFHPDELLVRLQQLIALRRTLQARNKAGELIMEATPKTEDVFLKNVQKIILENLGVANFGPNELAKAMMVSRSQLHRKLKALADISTSNYINKIRLQEAKKILLQSDKSVSEIAYEVGFSSPQYFSTSFSAAFACSPSDYRERMG